ncbi:MAG: hypothetical protein R3C58_15685 [Parvularculaceae bacterium]
MASTFDILGITLLTATLGLLLLRLRHERPPLQPYALIALVAIIGQELGKSGGGVAAVAFLMSAAFLLLHHASQPFEDLIEDNA